MIATAWRSLGWFLTGLAMTLGLLLVPLRVAAERKQLDRTTAAIAEARRDIRALDTEFDTRANMAQLERWNGETLKLVAPAAAQYVRDEGALAAIDARAGGAQVALASLVMPTAPVLPEMSAAPRKAAPGGVPTPSRGPAAVPARTVAVAAVAARPVAPPAVIRAPRAGLQRVAMLDRKLLSDSTIGDLLSGAKAETSGYR